MARGRPPKGVRLVERLNGSSEAKVRLKVILETIAGKHRISEACADLGIGEAAFHKLRDKVLEGALKSLEPHPSGRPRRQRSEADSRVAELEAENQELKVELRAAQIREEIAITMPHLLEDKNPGFKKKSKRKRERKLR